MDVKSNFRESVLALSPYGVSGHPAKIKLNQNESPFDVPPELKQEIIDKFLRMSWNRYPEVFPIHLPDQLSKIYGISSESIIVSNGSNELIYTVAMSIVQGGTEVLIPQPTFYLYEKVATILGGNIKKVYAERDLSLDEDKMLDLARRMNAGLIIVGSPNNPTGKSATRDFFKALVSATNAIVLVDEAYIEFSENESLMDLCREHKNLVVLRTFSKAFSLAGLRIGYLVAHPDTVREILKVKIPFTVNPLSEFTACELLNHKDLFADRVEQIKRSKQLMMDRLSQINGVKVVKSDANFFLFAAPLPPNEIFDYLLERKSVLVRDVSSYPLLERYLRVNAGTDEESLFFIESVKACLDGK
ncbi:MAG: histidinol-phosphate transaminase [Bacteroidetes bacterium]|nr:histidinol-phosphate transaminase [Bacteroidota bacterium]